MIEQLRTGNVVVVTKNHPDCVKTRRSFEVQPMITSFA
jgi:hypothetical protein